jgi:hypothetical protein
MQDRNFTGCVLEAALCASQRGSSLLVVSRNRPGVGEREFVCMCPPPLLRSRAKEYLNTARMKKGGENVLCVSWMSAND